VSGKKLNGWEPWSKFLREREKSAEWLIRATSPLYPFADNKPLAARLTFLSPHILLGFVKKLGWGWLDNSDDVLEIWRRPGDSLPPPRSHKTFAGNSRHAAALQFVLRNTLEKEYP